MPLNSSRKVKTMPDLEGRLRSLIQRKRDDLARFDLERNRLKQDIIELEAVLSATQSTELVAKSAKEKVKNPWSSEEDIRLFDLVKRYGTDSSAAKFFKLAGEKLDRTDKSVSSRVHFFRKAKKIRSKIIKDDKAHRGRRAILEVVE